MGNPYKSYSDEELCVIIKDIMESRKERKRVESFVPYAKEIKDDINGASKSFTLREALDMARQDFYDVVCERFLNKCK
jgi:hypothetical protein